MLCHAKRFKVFPKLTLYASWILSIGQCIEILISVAIRQCQLSIEGREEDLEAKVMPP